MRSIPELIVVTVSNRVGKAWEDYCYAVKEMFKNYPQDFKLRIISNNDLATSFEKKRTLHDIVGRRILERIDYTSTDAEFKSCRNAMVYGLSEDNYITILDDDDVLNMNFPLLFKSCYNFSKIKPDLISLAKRKVGRDFEVIGRKDKYFVKDKKSLFYDYDNYDKDKYDKFYPINGYNIIKVSLYKKTKTIESYVDDCYPQMCCYLNAENLMRWSIPWQNYVAQNNFREDLDNLSKCEASYVNQMNLLVEDYKNDEEALGIIKLQLINLIRSFETTSVKYDPTKLKGIVI